jgi:hypothetical protein
MKKIYGGMGFTAAIVGFCMPAMAWQQTPCQMDPQSNACSIQRCANRTDCPTLYVVISALTRGTSTQNFNPPLTAISNVIAGDLITLEARTRCFGNADVANQKEPTAPVVHTYEIQFDCDSFYSGASGSIRTDGLNSFHDPNGNCCAGNVQRNSVPRREDLFVDLNHPLFIFRGAEDDGYPQIGQLSYPSNSGFQCNNRVLRALSPPDVSYSGGSFCQQGANQPEKYLASMRVRVSPDAAGTFTMCLEDLNGPVIQGPDFARLFSFTATGGTSFLIYPMLFECATITVECNTLIAHSSLPNNPIDARQPSNLDGSGATGITMFDINTDPEKAGCLIPSHFTTTFLGESTTGPSVSSTAFVDFDTATLGLSGPIPLATWTRVIKMNNAAPTESSVCLAYLPGDVNQSRTTDTADMQHLVGCLNGTQVCGMHQGDLDRSNELTALDLARGMEILLGSQEFREWRGVNIPASPCGS